MYLFSNFFCHLMQFSLLLVVVIIIIEDSRSTCKVKSQFIFFFHSLWTLAAASRISPLVTAFKSFLYCESPSPIFFSSFCPLHNHSLSCAKPPFKEFVSFLHSSCVKACFYQVVVCLDHCSLSPSSKPLSRWSLRCVKSKPIFLCVVCSYPSQATHVDLLLSKSTPPLLAMHFLSKLPEPIPSSLSRVSQASYLSKQIKPLYNFSLVSFDSVLGMSIKY